MSALSFYTRPTYWCAKCGCPCEQEIDIEVDTGRWRSIWCNNSMCPQSHQRARVIDDVFTTIGTFKEHDPTLELPLGSEPDNNGRC